MAFISLLHSWVTPVAAGLVVLTFYLYPYFVSYSYLRGIPAPLPAQFSNLWLLSACRRGKRYLLVDQQHRKLGPVVRIQPNHISIADDEAIQIIYGHGNGFAKSYGNLIQ